MSLSLQKGFYPIGRAPYSPTNDGAPPDGARLTIGVPGESAKCHFSLLGAKAVA
jgi:hypothetical protein